ncbi:hypothetical protein ABE65_018330 [Fictibacillus phosphorivorans]|uniref:Amidase n=1 Tax=Fictibacillus phosphorivorans TaxID=1221500 RepID=A0A160IQV4_9BACL|nr:hypothetical protein [Fictibacillus phosphorivorans]ANC78646.1 hypothetical protein ABE65_018330 [Fictibacillus phosphorivorans]
MKNYRSFFALFAILVLVISMSSNVNAAKKTSTSNKKTYATWLWHTNKIVTEPEEVLSFLKAQKVNTLYLQINQDIPVSTYQEFLSKANEIGVSVQALDGGPDWIEPGHIGPKQFTNWLSSYQKEASKSEKFTGIHLDVEPYLLKEWNTNYQITVKRYQDLLESSKMFAKKMRLPLYVDLPFWFDEHNYSNSEFGKGKLSEWVIRNTDGISIMAYRNFTQGQNGILALTSSEVKFATKVNKKVVISIETDNVDELSYLSFHHLSHDNMKSTLDMVEQSYQREKSFDGFAIHHYVSWKSLTDL